ncbi:MAG TPA: cell division protein FtsA, partial [Leptospiraceae bacterium]|nr:cell division protein FtsA [Leptospiraceae bacterium]
SGGVVITGGGSRVEGAASLAEEVFSMAVRKGNPLPLGGFFDRVDGPEFATSVGLLIGAAQSTDTARKAPRESGSGWMQKLRSWVSENL